MNEEINLDFDRESRTGLGEAIFCSGKSNAQLRAILRNIQENDRPMLFTRMSEEQFFEIENVSSSPVDYDPVW